MQAITDEIITRLKKVGFTVYEAKTYLGLLRRNPATGYEISNEAGIPRSVIYAVLRKLESMGVVTNIQGKPRRYIPISPTQLISRLSADFNSRLEALREELTRFGSEQETAGFWNINGYDSLLQTCDSLIREARETIFLSGWRREIDVLKPSLIAARKRGVDIVIFSFTRIDPEFGQVFAYGIDEEKLGEIWDHKIILVVDSRDLVMGPANRNDKEQAIWTQNNAVITIAVNYIILDITLFGQRSHVDVSDTTVKLMTRRVDHLDHLIEISHR